MNVIHLKRGQDCAVGLKISVRRFLLQNHRYLVSVNFVSGSYSVPFFLSL